MGHPYPIKCNSLQTSGKILFHAGAGLGIKNENDTGRQWLR